MLRGRYDVAVAELRSQDTKLKEYTRLSAEVADLRAKYGNTGAEMSDLKTRYGQAVTELMEVKNRFTSAAAELNDIKGRYNSAMGELSEMRSRFGSSTAELAELRSKAESSAALNNELNGRIAMLYDTLNRVEQERASDKVNVERLVRDLQASRNVAVGELAQRDQAQEAHREELRQRQAVVMSELSSLMRDLEHYRQEAGTASLQLHSSIEQLNTKLAQEEAAIQQVRGQAAANTATDLQLNQKVIDVGAALQRLQTQVIQMSQASGCTVPMGSHPNLA